MRIAFLAAFLILIGACAPSFGTGASISPSPVRTARINDPARGPFSTTHPALRPAPTDAVVRPAGHTQFRVVSFVDAFLGWAAGSAADGNAFLVQTKDGGRSWSALPAPAAYITAGDELRFVDAEHAWLRTSVMIGSPGGCAVPSTAPPACRSVILRTSDGGRTWQEQLSVDQPSKLGPGLRALTVLDDLHAWAVQLGHSSGSSTDSSSSCTPFDCAIGVVATSDGRTWVPVGDLPAFVDGLDFVDALTGFASVHTAKNEPGTPTNSASIVVTHDGGRSWSTQLRVDGKGPRYFVNFIDPQIGFALEKEVATCGGSECWLYGLYRTSDAGQTWNKLLPTPVDISGAWWSPRGPIATLGTPAFSSATVGWIPITRDPTQQSFGGGVLVTSDGGRSWKRMPAAPEGWDVSGLAARRSSAWIVGQRASEDSFVAHTGDRGQTWDYPLLAQP